MISPIAAGCKPTRELCAPAALDAGLGVLLFTGGLLLNYPHLTAFIEV
jgi:hypothetical protein